jgi:hypothetical protein
MINLHNSTYLLFFIGASKKYNRGFSNRKKTTGENRLTLPARYLFYFEPVATGFQLFLIL